MKKRILVALAALMIFGLAAVVFAYNQSQNHQPQMSAGAHCPMHKQDGASAAEHKDSCCGMADCCKDGKCSMGGSCCAKKDKDSCPMKQQKDARQTSSGVDMTNVVVVGDNNGGGESCCGTGADCCAKGGACCHKKKG
ncbi:MAG: hypothetical protein M3384_18750 [Acidobacteriota bacterium]|nr:hypothetical protein [Acidobacteriota bacterium]